MAGAVIEPTGNKQGLPPLAGFNVVTKDGQQVYSRYTQEQLNARSQASQPSAQPNFSAEPSTIEKQSQDQFQQQRQEALRTGRFDYNAVKSSFYSPPSNYVNTKGQRVERVSKPPVEEKPLTSYQTRDIGTTTLETKPVGFTLSDTAAQESSQKIYQSLKTPETSTNQKPLEQTVNERIQQLNTKIEQQNKNTRESNIKSAQQQISDITKSLNEAKNAGVTSVNIVDEKGNVIGTVNPQNVPQARLQTLKTISKVKGTATLQYSQTSAQQTQGIESRVTTYTPSNIETAFVGGALGGFGEIGLIGLGGIAKLTGKEIKVPGTNTVIKPTGILQQAQEKTEKTFGTQTIDKILSGQKVDLSNQIELASIAGFGASIIATGGTGIIKAGAKAPSLIANAIRNAKITNTIISATSKEAKSVSGIGSADIGLSIKSTKDYSSIIRFEKQAANLPKAGTIKETPPPKTPTPSMSSGSRFTSTNINLGKGIGQLVPKEGGTSSLLNNFKKPSLPPSKPNAEGKETSAGKGLVQLVKEKPVIKQTQVFKEYPIQLGKSKLELVQKTQKAKVLPRQKLETRTKAQQKTEEYLQQLKKSRTKQVSSYSLESAFIFKKGQVEKNKQTSISELVSKTQSQKSKQTFANIYQTKEKIKSVSSIIPKFKQTQKTQPINFTSLITRPRNIPIPPKIITNPIPDNQPLKFKEPPPGKKKPPFIFGGGRGKTSLSGLSGGSGARKGYIGNVPESSIIGTYNRTEISYGGARTSNTHKSAFKKLQGSKSFKL